MKRFLVITALALMSGLLIMSCDKEGENFNSPDDFTSISSENLFVDNTIFEEDAVTSEVTMDEELSMIIEEPEEEFIPPQRPPKRGKHIRLGRVFREMELTPDQMDSVHKYMRMMHECEWYVKRTLFENVKPYMDSINRERRIIINKLRNDEITREEARELMRELNIAVREYMMPIKIRTMEALKNCHERFIFRVASVLTEDQLAIWREFWSRFQ